MRVFSQHDGQPVYVVNSTFGRREGLGIVCANGAAVSRTGVSWTVINSVLTHNDAIGWGANGDSPRGDSPGGGNPGGDLQRRQSVRTVRDRHHHHR